MSDNKCLISLWNKAAEKHYVPSLFSAGFPNSLSASCSSICTQILVPLFSAIANARTAALPGCSARAKLWLLRLMMARTMKVGEVWPRTETTVKAKQQPWAANSAIAKVNISSWDGAMTSWHKSGFSCPFNEILPRNNFLIFYLFFFTKCIPCKITQCIQIWCNWAKNNFKRLFNIYRNYSLPTHWMNVFSTHQNELLPFYFWFVCGKTPCHKLLSPPQRDMDLQCLEPNWRHPHPGQRQIFIASY